MSKFYSRAGDDGLTGRLGEGRIFKESALVELLGSLDEASAALGLGRATAQSRESEGLLLEAQRDLYHMMAEISATPEAAANFRKIDSTRINWLETRIDLVAQMVSMPREFIVPGDTLAGAAMALARTAVRRAERRLAGAVHQGEIENPHLLPYLNRLSSLCFVLELLENQVSGSPTVTLAKRKA